MKKVCLQQEEDAPGWSGEGELGPICWKCLGTGEKQMQGDKPAKQCPVCFGEKRLKKKVLRKSKPKPHRCNDIGPDFANIPIEINNDTEELSQLLGKWKILQSLKGGHRWSTDDLVTAWVACKSIPTLRVRKHLDLGCGIGTVLLMCAWYFRNNAHEQQHLGVGVEAQSASASRAKRSIAMNALQDQLSVVESDFRQFSTQDRFDLITGTPPYFPVSQHAGVAHPEYGALPTFEQSAPARFEFRGGLEVYVETASRLLCDDDGVVVLCEGNLHATDGMKRVLASAEANGMHCQRSVFVHGREDKPALFAVHVLTRRSSNEQEFVREKFVVRHVGGRRSDEYVSMCKDMGILFHDDDGSIS